MPVDCRDAALLAAREHGNVHRSGSFGAEALVRLLERCDAFRRGELFEQVLIACEADARGRTGLEDRPYPQRERLRRALAAAQTVSGGAVAAAVSGDVKDRAERFGYRRDARRRRPVWRVAAPSVKRQRRAVRGAGLQRKQSTV